MFWMASTIPILMTLDMKTGRLILLEVHYEFEVLMNSHFLLECYATLIYSPTESVQKSMAQF